MSGDWSVGVIGAGHFAEFLVQGWLRAGRPPESIIVSPRGRSADLAARFGVGVAESLPDLAARRDRIVLSVRPKDAAAALAEAGLGARHLVVSVCAGVTLGELSAAAPDARCIRAMPVSAAKLGRSPTTVFPDDPAARDMLTGLGPLIPLEAEAAFEAASVNAAVYAWVHGLIAETARWSAAHGMEAATARKLAAESFAAAGAMAGDADAPDLDAMVAALATPGGISEAGFDALGERGVPEAWRAACDAARQRLRRS